MFVFCCCASSQAIRNKPYKHEKEGEKKKKKNQRRLSFASMMPPISLEPLISQEILNPVLNLGGQQQTENKFLFSMTTKGKIEDANEGKCS